MRPPRPVPAEIADRAFSRAEAIELGVSPRMLQHPRFVEVFPCVYRHEDVELNEGGRIHAARLALPADARLSHQTRLRLLGLQIGSLNPMHFTVARDHHLVIDDIMLHRTVKMPPCDDDGVAIAAAFVGAASQATLIQLISIGDWLLHRGLLRASIVRHLALTDPWRPGSTGALAVLDLLDGRSRSLPESECRSICLFSGLPVPEINADIVEAGEFVGCGDLVYRLWRLVVEYEGRQHAFSTKQFGRDIERYRGFRHHGWAYLQVTQHDVARPKALAIRIHDELSRRGYDGAPPVFGRRWHSLFESAESSRGAVTLQRHSA
jgi:hypothetical protein